MFAIVVFDIRRLRFLLNDAIRKHAKKYETDTDFVNKMITALFLHGWFQ